MNYEKVEFVEYFGFLRKFFNYRKKSKKLNGKRCLRCIKIEIYINLF